MPTCDKHRNDTYEIDCLCAHMVGTPPHCCVCLHDCEFGNPLTTKYLPPLPGSDRWNEAAEAHFRAKWMPSGEAINFLDAWKYEKPIL
jgi:hypothetical protein